MKPLRTFLPLLFLIFSFIYATPALSAAKPQEISGTVMAAETNKPVSGAMINFFVRSDKGLALKASTTTTSSADGKFNARLPKGSYTWFVAAEGFGTWQSGTTVTDFPVDLSVTYLRKPALMTGRLLDGSGKAMPGIVIAADNQITATSGPDGRFNFGPLDPHGYEPALRSAGWVLEKSSYHYLSQGENKELGDLVIRRAAQVTVRLKISENGITKQLNNVRINLSGNSVHRSATVDKKGVVQLNDLPPGRFNLYASDERLKESHLEIILAEGEKQAVTLSAELRTPTLSIEEYSEVFLPEKPVKLRANALRVEKAEATLLRIPAAALLNRSVDLRKPEAISSAALERVTTIPVTFKSRRNSHQRFASISVPGLKSGGYLLELKNGTTVTRFSFLVTRLGLVAKAAPGETLLFATDLINGTPQKGVEISGVSGSSIRTEADGMTGWSGSRQGGRLIARNGDDLAFLDLPSGPSHNEAATTKGYVYTERPVYRPGQTVFFKGVLRQVLGEGYKLPATGQVQISIKDDNDKEVCSSNQGINGNGSFNGSCDLPQVPALGDYSITAVAAGQSWQGSFKVLAYRKPEFEVTVTSDRSYLVTGDTGQIKVSGTYYFGAPVAGGKLVWRMYSRPAWGLGGGDEEFYGDEERFGGYADFIGEGEVTLDEHGQAIIPITAKAHEMPSTYTLEADVSDASGRQVSASGSVHVVPSLVALNVKAANYLAKPGVPQEITVRAASWEGTPKDLPLRLTFGHQVYVKKTKSYQWKEASAPIQISTLNGVAHTSFSFPSPGYWQIKAEAADEAGRKAEATSSVWVWREGHAWEGSYRDLEAEFDRKSYKPGDTARLIVRSPVTGGSLLLTLEGRDIYERRIVPLNGMVEVLEIPVTTAQAPYIHVSALTVGNGRFFNRSLPLKVDFQPDTLDLKITQDKPIYRPGDTVQLNITSNRDGQKVPAELSLGVVDEAVYAIARERSEDIWHFFRGSREHLVSTLHSFPRVFLGGAAKEKAEALAKDDGLKGLKVRKIFKDTAAWYPQLETKADGSATAIFTLPDNLTTWRATAIGHTLTSQFGTARQKFIARLELMARLSPPRFFVAGDQLQVPGVITSMLDQKQQARGRFEASGLTLLGDASFNGEIEPRGSLRATAGVKAEQPGNALLRLLAAGNDAGDAMELTLPVLPRSIERAVGSGIALRSEQASIELVIPVEALTGTSSLSLTFAPSIATSLNSAITQLVEFPYGCVEQTLSRFIPAVHAKSLLGRSGWQPDPAMEAKLPLVVAEGIRRLEEMQHDDGGWGWWKTDSTSLTMTAHALYGLGLAKRAGVAVPENLLTRGLSSLENQAGSALTDDLPRVYRALAVNERRNEAVEKRLATAWKTLSLADLLAYGEALAFAEQREAVAPLIEQLKKEVQHEGQAAYLKDKDAESWWYGWRWGSSAVETTASMLTLLVKQAPNDPLNAGLAAFLARRQEGGWWRTTTASAAAITALADYVASSGETTASYNAVLKLGNDQVATWKIENGRLVAGDSRVAIPAERLKSGPNRLTLSKNGTGAAYLAATLTYQAAPEAARSVPELKLERTLYRISTVKEKDTWRREYTPLKPGEAVKAGDDIEVRLTLESKRDLEYVIIEDRLPAGFESRETDRDPRFMDESAYLGWYSHRERRDEKLAFFITSLPAGRHEFRHVLYPEIAGQMLALPAAAWPMYQPELRGESRPWNFDVR